MYISHYNDTTTACIRGLYDARLDLHIYIYSYIIHVVLGMPHLTRWALFGDSGEYIDT